MTDFNAFTASSDLVTEYINLKYSAATKAQWIALSKKAGQIISQIRDAKADVYTDGPKVHGAFTQSKLDMMDKFELKALNVFDNAQHAAASTL